MSDAKRYDFYCHTSDFLLGSSLITELCDDGDFVFYSDYATLRAENERLKALLREAEPFILDIHNMGGFHALETGELHGKIQHALCRG